MNLKAQVKPKRHKKRKSRTQVSSDSDSEYSIAKSPSPPPPSGSKTSAPSQKSENSEKPAKSKNPPISKEHEINATFIKFYMQQATTEFAEDLDKVRQASDFKDDALPILIQALQQGTEMWGPEERRRVVLAGEGGE